MWVLGVWWVLLGTVGAGSAQLLFHKYKSVKMDSCNESVLLPCIVTNLNLNNTRAMFVKWKVQGNEFFAYDGYLEQLHVNSSFKSAKLVSLQKLPYGIASLVLSKDEALPGNYSCEVTESNREGETVVELKSMKVPWFSPVENTVIILTILVAIIFYWIQLFVVASKFEVTLNKKIILIIAGLTVTIAAVVGSIFLVPEGFVVSNQVGLGLIILPAVTLIPLLYVLLGSVFEKPPRFAIILVVVKAVGYLIAVIGFAVCVTACPPQEAPVIISGLAIIDLVAVIGVVYVIVIGSNFKDHQPPRKAVEEPLNVPAVK